MKPDNDEPTFRGTVTDIERAHLKESKDTSHEMFRYDFPPEFDGLARSFWIPVWSVSPGESAPQKVLQYPVCLLVVASDYARFYGVTSGLSTTTLSGEGWAVGVMLEPAAGQLLTGRSVDEFTDRHVDLSQVLGHQSRELVTGIRAVMTTSPHSPEAHAEAMRLYGNVLRRFLPADAEGSLVNKITAYVEANPEVVRVSQVCAAFGLSERTLQRLVRHRVGLTPKWLIQRRRLHDAVGQLRLQENTLAGVASDLGYADEAHFIRDFSRVTGTTPGRFAAQHRV